MNYRRIYNDLIENRQQNPITEGYSENHHILPRSLGGSNNLDNLVKLSAREHFICHYLLAKIYKKNSLLAGVFRPFGSKSLIWATSGRKFKYCRPDHHKQSLSRISWRSFFIGKLKWGPKLIVLK